MTPNRPLTESKRTLFLRNRQILTPNRDSRKSCLASKNNPFFRVSMVAHVYNTIIQVAHTEKWLRWKAKTCKILLRKIAAKIAA